MPDEAVDCKRYIRPQYVFRIDKSCRGTDEYVSAHEGHECDAGFILKEWQEHAEIHRHRAELKWEKPAVECSFIDNVIKEMSLKLKRIDEDLEREGTLELQNIKEQLEKKILLDEILKKKD